YGSDRDWKIVTVCLEKWQSDLWVQLGKQWVSVTQKQCSDDCGDRRRFSQTCTTQRKQMLRIDAYPSAVQFGSSGLPARRTAESGVSRTEVIVIGKLLQSACGEVAVRPLGAIRQT